MLAVSVGDVNESPVAKIAVEVAPAYHLTVPTQPEAVKVAVLPEPIVVELTVGAFGNGSSVTVVVAVAVQPLALVTVTV